MISFLMLMMMFLALIVWMVHREVRDTHNYVAETVDACNANFDTIEHRLDKQKIKINTCKVSGQYDTKKLAEDLGVHVQDQLNRGVEYVDGPNGWVKKPKKKGKK